MKKKTYEKLTYKFILLQHETMLLAGSPGDPVQPDAPLWDGECDSRRRGNIDWDEDYREGE